MAPGPQLWFAVSLVMVALSMTQFLFAPDPESHSEGEVASLRARITVLEQQLKKQAPAGGAMFPDKRNVRVISRSNEVLRMDIPSDVMIREVNLTRKYKEGDKVKEMDIFLMGTSTNPSFIAAVQHPNFEAASRDLYKNGDMEKPTRRMFEFLLINRCQEKGALMVDAGANLGYFSTYAAIMGCRVISIEAQPRLIPIIKTGPEVNGRGHASTIHNKIVHTEPGARVAIQYASGGCWGCSYVVPLKEGQTAPAGAHVVTATRVDEVASGDIALLKVDIEGYEVLGIESAMGTIEKYNVENILVEWAPRRFPHSVERGTKLLEKLSDMGYVIRHYDMRFVVPLELVVPETHWPPLAGKMWRIERENLGKMNEFLKTTNRYGEANLWISKTHPVRDEKSRE